VNAAWWALAGVGAAGGLGLAKDWLIENRRTSLAWKRTREDELRSARVACLLIADELNTHAMNYKLLADLRRTAKRPVAQTPNFLSSREWEAHKLDLARLTAVPNETWQGLFNAYHNAQQLRSRIEIDGPEAPFPSHRIDDLRTH